MSDTAIVQAVVAFAACMDLTVTVEGVETATQREAVRRMGCDRAQGYFFAPPMPGEEAARLLTATPGRGGRPSFSRGASRAVSLASASGAKGARGFNR